LTLTRVDIAALKNDLRYYQKALRELGQDPARITDPQTIHEISRLYERNIAEIRGELAREGVAA
jgi:hypothetical protein